MQISDAESRVMQVLWDNGPSTAEDVVQALAHVSDWQDATIKTLLNRLLNKGAIRAEKDGRRYLYSPMVKREDWVLAESRGLDVELVRPMTFGACCLFVLRRAEARR